MISHGRRFMTDPALAFFVTACVGCALTALHRTERARLFAMASGVALGFGFLAKGPVAVILSGLAIAGAVGASRGVKGFLSRPVLELYAIYALCLAPAVGYWLWLLDHEGGRDLVRFWVDYHRGGAKGEEGTPHLKPFWFYVTRGSDGVMPWIFFLPLLAWRTPDPGQTTAPLLREIGVWALLPLLFLSALAQKRDLYTLPLLPPVALLAAVAILDAPREGQPARVGRVGWSFLSVVLVLLGVAGAGYGLAVSLQDRDLAGALLAGALLVAMGVLVFVSPGDPEERDGPLAYPFAIMAFGAVFATVLVAFVQPRSRYMENTIRPTMRALVEKARLDQGNVLHGYKLGDGTAVVNGALTLELGDRFHDVTTTEELTKVLHDPRSRVVLRKAAYVELGKPGRLVTEEHAVRRGHGEGEGWKHEYVLVAGTN